jgi:Contractile injection system tube protein
MIQALAPNLTKAVLVTAPILTSMLPPRVVVFQYNPTELTRSIQPNYNDSKNLGFNGPATESISLTAYFDATASLADPSAGSMIAQTLGIYDQLSNLQLMLYPSTAAAIKNAVEAAAGSIEIASGDVPLTVFVWGMKRIVPVKVTSLNITEQAFDDSLNPIRAQVSISMQVLSDSDVNVSSTAYGLYMVHQVAQEAMALIATAKGTAQVTNSVSSLI